MSESTNNSRLANQTIPTEQQLLEEIQQLRLANQRLQRENSDLSILLENTTEHADSCERELLHSQQSLSVEVEDLKIILDAATQHGDGVANELLDRFIAATKAHEAQLVQILDAIPIGIFVVDAQMQPYYANSVARTLLQTESWQYSIANPRVYLRHHVFGTFSPEQDPQIAVNAMLKQFENLYISETKQRYSQSQQPFFRALQGESVRLDHVELHSNGCITPLEISAMPIRDQQQRVCYAIAVFQDISERLQAEAERLRYAREIEARKAVMRINDQLQKEIEEHQQTMQTLQQANQQLTRLAALDGLTQIANRRRFDEYLETEWSRMCREDSPLALILCDIDYFKAYNDHYGHQAGDLCLKQVAKALKRVTKRPADLVARYGGEEFAMILPNTDLEGAQHVADHALQTVREARIAHAGSTVSPDLTISLGISVMSPESHCDVVVSQLLFTTDQALYAAKQQGRNRWVAKLIEACVERV